MVEGGSVIRLMIQFMRENGLERSCQMLCEESGVQLNTLPDPAALTLAIRSGRWDAVLSLLATLSLPAVRLYDLYELMVVDLVAAGELDAARMVLRRSAVLTALRGEGGRGESRYLRMEALISQASTVDPHAADDFFGRDSIMGRREWVADRLERELTRVPNGRLLTLLGQALQYQLNQGILPSDTTINIFHGIAPNDVALATTTEIPVTKLFLSKSFRQSIEAVVFSPDGKIMAAGRADGGLELLHPATGQRLLDHQAGRASAPVMTLAFSSDGSLLAAGLYGGHLALLQLPGKGQTTPADLKEIAHLHDKGITALHLSQDASSILTAGYDSSVRITSLRTTRPLQHFSIDSSYVTDCCFSPDETRVYACSADGMFYGWNRRTASLVCTLRPFGDEKLLCRPLARIHCSSPTEILVVAKNGSVALIKITGSEAEKRVMFLLPEKQREGEEEEEGPTRNVVASALSPKRTILYILFDDKQLSVHRLSAEATLPSMPDLRVSEEEVFGLAVHPILGHAVTFEMDGILKFWRPESQLAT